tara:strand:+ start:54 stop:248 length:195 start_codon:yes stop_codon:yes gene_type:complete
MNIHNNDHLVTLFKDAHWRSLDSICSHPLDAEAIEDLAEDLGYDILAEILRENRIEEEKRNNDN